MSKIQLVPETYFPVSQLLLELADGFNLQEIALNYDLDKSKLSEALNILSTEIVYKYYTVFYVSGEHITASFNGLSYPFSMQDINCGHQHLEIGATLIEVSVGGSKDERILSVRRKPEIIKAG